MPSTTKVPLKYYWVAIYKDGSVLEQNEDDVSTQDPLRSAFYDVKQDELKAFGIMSEGEEDNWFGIDLETGQFDTSHAKQYGFSFTLANPGPKPYSLVFWRQHTHNFNVEYIEQEHIVRYILGYKDADGVEHTITID